MSGSTQTVVSAQERAQLLAYARQQADSGGYATLLSRVLMANASGKAQRGTRTRRRDEVNLNPYKLSVPQLEVLDMIYALGSVGCGQGMSYALERLKGLHLIERLTNGFYVVTDKGRVLAAERAGR